jgi:hypothetical protein
MITSAVPADPVGEKGLTLSITEQSAADTDVDAIASNLIPGAGALGFGIDVTAASDWTIRTSLLVGLDTAHGTNVLEPQNGPNQTEYLLPHNVSVVDIWQTSTSYDMYSSRSEYATAMSATAAIQGSAWGFSAEFNASYSKIAEGQSTAFYGQSSTKTRLWNVSVNDLSDLSLDRTFHAALGSLPGSFSSANQHEFYTFFAKWGTHVITSATVGGSLDYSVTVNTSASLTKETAEASATFEYKSLLLDASGSASADWSRMGQAWLASRKASLQVTGGDPDVLDGFTPPSDFAHPVNFNDMYTKWTTTVSGRPGVVAARLQPISNLASGGQVGVLAQALNMYLNASAEATVEMTMPDGKPVTASLCSVGVGVTSVPAPHAQVLAVQPMYWVVMADHDGTVVFNENVLSGDPDDLDKIVADATAVAGTGNYWTVAVSYGTTGVLSPLALQWFKSWGVSIPTKWPSYPGAPHLFTAVGQSNSSVYPAVVSVWSPGILYQMVFQVTAQAPLYAGGSAGG